MMDPKQAFREFWPDGYYWARHDDGSRFVVLRQHGLWYCVGVREPLDSFDDSQIVCPVKRAEN